MPEPDEFFGQVGNDPLSAAIETGRNALNEGATCAILITNACIAAKFRSRRVGSASSKPFDRGDQENARSELEPNGGTGAVQVGITPANTEQLRRCERDTVCSIFDDSMISRSGCLRKDSATSDSIGIPVSPFLASSDRDPRQGVAAPRPRKKLMNGSGLARLQKLLQRLIPDLTGFFPGAKLTA
jgi:hypothetical protein